MRKIILIEKSLIFVFFICFNFSSLLIADEKEFVDELSSNDITIITMLSKTSWSLRLRYKDPKYPPFETNDVIKVIQNKDYIPSAVASIPHFGLTDEKIKHLWNLNKDAIIDYINSMTLLGGDLFYYLNEPERTLQFIRYDGKIYLLIDGFGIGVILNTLRLDSKERAKEILNRYAIDALMRLGEESFKEIDGVIIVLTYGSKDFSKSDTYLNLRGESLLITASFGQVELFRRGEIDDIQFIKSLKIFLSDRNDSNARRINLADR